MFTCIMILSVVSCGNTVDNTVYGPTIGGLEDDELFAVIKANANAPVLLVTDQVYGDGLGNLASIACDVYYVKDGEVKNIGRIESLDTSYPITYDLSGIYASSGHGMQRFEIYDSDGALHKIEEEAESEDYEKAEIVNFAYGASGT